MPRTAILEALPGIVCAALLLPGCAAEPPLPEDPLRETIVEAAGARPLSREQLVQRLAQADVVYIGETHDNRRHHQIQLELLRELVAAGRRPQIGMEFFAREQTSYLHRYLQPAGPHGATRDRDADLRRAVNWGPARDRDWAHYRPILELARAQGLQVFGADLPDGLRRRLAQVGLAGLHPVESLLVPASDFDDPGYRELMFEVFTAAHCGWREENLLGRLYETWTLRNESMAAAIVAAAAEGADGPVVLITGAGHVRGNRGVYERVARHRPQLRQVNLGLREVALRPQPLAHYLEGAMAGASHSPADHDVFWFTARSSYRDPCEQFAEHLRRKPGAD